jgi:PilZ domain
MSDFTKSGKKPGQSSAATAETERRSGNRHSFTASAEVVDLGSGARFSTRMTDLSDGGCFVDTMVPFPVGSKVHVKVHQGKNEFETGGTVVYSQYGLGMGVAFENVDPERRKALDRWIQELSGELHSEHDLTRSLAPVNNKNPGSDNSRLVRLVQLMITKGILTEAEGSSVLHDPLL